MTDKTDDKPLDPSIERVRRKLLRFMFINLSLLFGAVIIVVAAIVYRSAKKDAAPASVDIAVPSGEVVSAEIPLPPGARVVSQSLSGSRVSLHVEAADGRRELLIYDFAERRVIARLTLGGG